MSKQCNPPRDRSLLLEARLSRAYQGRTADCRVLESRFARMGSYPLSQWFGAHPERLDQLRAAFPDLGECATFGQAAALLWAARKTRKSTQAMWLLLSPLLDIDRYLVKLSDGGGYSWGNR